MTDTARKLFEKTYPNGFGHNRQSWDDLQRESESRVSSKDPWLAQQGPIRARRLLDAFIADAERTVGG